MSEERFKRIRSYFHTAVAILFLLLVAYAARSAQNGITASHKNNNVLPTLFSH